MNRDGNGNTPLHRSVTASDKIELIEGIIREKLENLNIDELKGFICAENNDGFTAMRLAVEHNRLNTVEYLHIRLSLFSNYVREPFILHLAAQKGYLDMVVLLLQYGWNIEELDHTGQTILHVAAENNNVSLIKMLLKRRMDKRFMEGKDEDGNTPILDAAWRNNCEAFKILHSAGASLSACSNFDQTILSAATRSNSTKIVKYLTLMEPNIVKMLCYERNFLHDTPLHIVAKTGNIEIFNTILQFYENVNPLNSSNETPLHVAVKFNSIEIVKQILQLSTFSVCLNSAEGTPLMIAVEKGFVTIVEMLIKNDATKKLKIMERKTLLQISIYHKRYQILKLLSKDLSKHLIDQNDIDKILQHSLKLSIIEEFNDGVEYFLSRNDWKSLMRRRPKSELNSILKSPMQLLIEHLPQMAISVFDKCFVVAYITVMNKTKEVTFADYEFLDDVYFIPVHPKGIKNDDLSTYDKATGKLKPEAKSRANPYNKIVVDHPLQLMLKHKRYELFSHKLVESYITTKWNNFVKWGYYFCMNFTFSENRFWFLDCLYHFIFVLFLSFVIITIPPDKVVSSKENQKPHLDAECLMNPLQKSIAAIFAAIHLIMTSYKIYRYFNFLSRFLDILIVLLTFTAALPFCRQLNNTIEWSILTVLYLFVWMSLLNLLKKLPRFGIYVLMIFYTLKVFLRFAPVFIMFLLPFVVSFYVLLYEKRGKSTFFEATVRTLLMMIGEYDYRESIKEKATLLIQLLICLFLMVMTIFLMNLLIGLAVSDTTATLEKALRLRIKLQIETIHHVEIDMPESLRRHFWRGFRITKKSIGEDYEEDNPIGSFRQLFRWFGLSKDALKKEIPVQLSDTNNFNNSFDVESRLQKNSENISKKCDSLVNKQNNLLKITERLEENVHQITDLKQQNGSAGKYISKVDI